MKAIRFPALLLALAVTGCAHQRAMKGGSASEGASSGQAGESTLASAEANVRNSILHSIDDLKTVRFAYDSALLDADTRSVLSQNAQWLKEHPEVRAQVAGHCDQRGSVEYNLALGQRRAKAVRDYYLKLGVAAKRIATISYGKEKPLCETADEGCWGTNRRAETLGAFPQDVSRK